MAGTLTLTSNTALRDREGKIIGKRLVINGTGDAADGSFPTLSLKKMNGYLQPIITNPGATAPTDNYDIALYHPSDSTGDAAGGAFADRDTANTETKAATVSGSASPIYLNGTYTLAITGNSVNSATTQIIMDLLFLDR